MSFSYCLEGAEFPQPTGIPSTCFYTTTGNGQKVWFGVLGDEIPEQGDSLTVSLFNKSFDRYENGTIIPPTDRPPALENIHTIRIPPTTAVELYSDELCSPGSKMATLGGKYLEYHDDPNFDGYGEVTLSGEGLDQLSCIKLIQYEAWDTFIDDCENANTPQNICQQYASTTDQGSQTGGNNIPPPPDGDGGDDGPIPDDDRGYMYTLIGILVVTIIIIVIMCILVRYLNSKRKPKTKKEGEESVEEPNQFESSQTYRSPTYPPLIVSESSLPPIQTDIEPTAPPLTPVYYGERTGLEPKQANINTRPVPYRRQPSPSPEYVTPSLPRTPSRPPPPLPPRGNFVTDF